MSILQALMNLFRRQRRLADLARWLEEPEADLRAWLPGGNAPWTRGYAYERFSRPKRSGGRRVIHAPNSALKTVQRKVLWRLLRPLKLPPAVTGFAPGRSIVDNARPHVGRGVVINLDLADFFPSITLDQVRAVWRGLGWDEQASEALAQICTLEGRLPQGAPTSPALSNLVCRKLDARLTALAAGTGGRYTRYADDLTLSFAAFGRNKRRGRWPKGKPRPAVQPGPSRSLVTLVRQIIEDEGFKIQMKKRLRIQRPHQRQTATGLVVNAVLNVPRATRRLMRAMRHRQALGQLDEAGQRRLRGLEAFQAMVEKQRDGRS